MASGGLQASEKINAEGPHSAHHHLSEQTSSRGIVGRFSWQTHWNHCNLRRGFPLCEQGPCCQVSSVSVHSILTQE